MTPTPTQNIAKSYLAWCKRRGYLEPIANDELDAVRRCLVIESLGYRINSNDIRREVNLSRASNKRKAVKS